jgi:hypothetical protein
MSLSKQDEFFNFLFHKNYDISEISKHLLSFTKEWFIDTSRQELYVSHRETNSYFINEHSNSWKINDSYNPEFKCTDEKLWQLIKPIIQEFEKIHDGKMGKVLFINLPAEKVIDGHFDRGDYLDVVRRHHLAITTNPKVLFSVGNETLNMAIGECWEINNNHFHSVSNLGETNRIHLLFDIIPNKYLNS